MRIINEDYSFWINNNPFPFLLSSIRRCPPIGLYTSTTFFNRSAWRGFGHRNKNGEGKNKKVKESHRRYAPPNTPLNANGHQHSYRRRFRVGKWTKENFIALAPFLDLSLVPLFVSCTLSLSGPSTNRDSSRRPYSCPQGLSRRTSHHPLG